MVEGSEPAIVRVDMRPRQDVLRRKTDDLPEFQDRRAFRNFGRRHLVSARDTDRSGNAFHGRADLNGVDRHDKAVVGIEAQGAVL